MSPSSVSSPASLSSRLAVDGFLFFLASPFPFLPFFPLPEAVGLSDKRTRTAHVEMDAIMLPIPSVSLPTEENSASESLSLTCFDYSKDFMPFYSLFVCPSLPPSLSLSLTVDVNGSLSSSVFSLILLLIMMEK